MRQVPFASLLLAFVCLSGCTDVSTDAEDDAFEFLVPEGYFEYWDAIDMITDIWQRFAEAEGNGDRRSERDIDLGYDIPPITGGFEHVTAFTDVFGSADHLIPHTREEAYHGAAKTYVLAIDLDWDGDQDILFSGLFADREYNENALIWNRSNNQYELERFDWHAGEPPPDWVMVGTCISAVDIVGDAANDLLCYGYPGLIVVEGELIEGRSGIHWDRTHVIEPRSFDPMYEGPTLVDEGINEFRESEKWPYHNDTEFQHAGVNQLLAVDLDANGFTDIVVSTFALGASDFVYLQHENGVWERYIVHYGQSFGAVPMWIDAFGQWCIHFMTEGGKYEADWNENAILCYQQETNSFERLYPEARPVEDSMGYLGPLPENERNNATPMGCSTWQVMPDEPALYTCSQNTPDFPVFEWRDGELSQIYESLPGANPIGITSNHDDPRWRVMWSQATTSLRGLAGVQDFVSVSAGSLNPEGVNTMNGDWIDPEPGYSAVQVLVRESDRFTDVGVEFFQFGAWESLQVTDQNGDARPDFLIGGIGNMPAMALNRLESVGKTLHVVPRGCDHSCRIEVGYNGHTYRQPVTNTGNPVIMGSPEVFIGLGDATEATVRLVRGTNDPIQEATVSLNGSTWYFDPGVPPYQHDLQE